MTQAAASVCVCLELPSKNYMQYMHVLLRTREVKASNSLHENQTRKCCTTTGIPCRSKLVVLVV